MNTQRGRLSRPDGSKRAKLEHLLCASLLFKHFLLLAVMIIVGTNVAWGQEQTTDYSGIYYIASGGKSSGNGNGYTYNPNNPSNNFYLCPTEGWCYYKATDDYYRHDTEDENKTMPFLTTYKCRTNAYHSGDASGAVWEIIKAPNSEYYYIIQKSTGRYLISNGQIKTTNNPDRIRVLLESIADPAAQGDKVLFEISPLYSTYTDIRRIEIWEKI